MLRRDFFKWAGTAALSPFLSAKPVSCSHRGLELFGYTIDFAAPHMYIGRFVNGKYREWPACYLVTAHFGTKDKYFLFFKKCHIHSDMSSLANKTQLKLGVEVHPEIAKANNDWIMAGSKRSAAWDKIVRAHVDSL